jgi:hypothetical protein
MLPVSTDFLAAVRHTHPVAVRARVITPGATGVDPPGRDLKIEAGTVTLDGRANVRGSVDLTLVERWPRVNATTEILPYGTEIAVSRGIVFGNGRIERVPLGIYRLQVVEQGEAPDGPLRVTGLDRMTAIGESRFLAPVTYPATALVGTVVNDLVQAVLPSAVIQWDDATNVEQLGRKLLDDEDRFKVLNDLVTSLGKIWYFDYRGILVIKDPPSPAAVVFNVSAGRDGVLTSLSRSLSRDEVYNAVVATGEGMDGVPPAYGVAYDLDQRSPTYWNGPYGKVPRFYSSPKLTTNARAVKAAKSMLTRTTGLPYSVGLGAVPNPALEPYDAVTVTYPPERGRAVRTETHVLDQVKIPLHAAGEMTLETRLTTTAGVFE